MPWSTPAIYHPVAPMNSSSPPNKGTATEKTGNGPAEARFNNNQANNGNGNDINRQNSSSTVVSSSSSTFRSSSSASSSLLRTGNTAYDQDVAETMEYFECELDGGGEPPHSGDASKLYGILVRLPCYGPYSRTRDFCYLRVHPRASEDGGRYTADYTIEKRANWMSGLADGELQSVIEQAKRRSQRVYRRNHREEDRPSIVCFIDAFYYTLEERQYPGKRVLIRDFCYSVYDPRHWGRPLLTLMERAAGSCSYRAQARFDFRAAAEGELSMHKGDMLYVLADFGNGWLSVRKGSPRHGQSQEGGDPGTIESKEDNGAGDRDGSSSVGLVPENYVERIP